MRIYEENQRELISAAFDHAKQLALHALDTRHCIDMWFRLSFGVGRVPRIESNINEDFLNDKASPL